MFKLALFTFATSLALTTAASAHKAKPQTFTGTLHTGIVAIGGETTGIEITTDSGTYEVDLHGDKAMTKAVDNLDGKTVKIIGELTARQGVEIRERHIIVADALTASK